MSETEIVFEAADDAAEQGGGLRLDLDGFEGPLDVLLLLARAQKVDLAQISLIALVDQYLAFIEDAEGRRIDLAADYLVMALWLTFLKSRLLLPKPERPSDEPDPEALSLRLQQKLLRLAQARAAAAALQNLAQLDRDVFLNGDPTPVKVAHRLEWRADLFDLLQAYCAERARLLFREHRIEPRRVYPLEDARKRLEAALPELRTWKTLDSLAPRPERGPRAPTKASYVASLLGATLELVRDQKLEAQQAAFFAPVFVRRRSAP